MALQTNRADGISPSLPSDGRRNRFLSVLGALDPSKVKDLDLGSAREKKNAPKKASASQEG